MLVFPQHYFVNGGFFETEDQLIARAMGERGPKAQCVEFAGVGHAPTLIDPGQISAVQLFLSQSD